MHKFTFTFRQPYDATDKPNRRVTISAADLYDATSTFRDLYPNADLLRLDK